MPRYRFTGDQPEEFPTLGRVLAPGDEIETDAPVTHARLEAVAVKAPKSAKAEE